MPAKYLTSFQLRDILGGISTATLARWIDDPAKGFPKPIKIGAARLWNSEEVAAYLDRKATEAA